MRGERDAAEGDHGRRLDDGGGRPPERAVVASGVAQGDELPPETTPVSPRYASVPVPTVPLAIHVPPTSEYLVRPIESSAT